MFLILPISWDMKGSKNFYEIGVQSSSHLCWVPTYRTCTTCKLITFREFTHRQYSSSSCMELSIPDGMEWFQSEPFLSDGCNHSLGFLEEIYLKIRDVDRCAVVRFSSYMIYRYSSPRGGDEPQRGEERVRMIRHAGAYPYRIPGIYGVRCTDVPL